ncbi:MAG: rhomboid family intramembrane serine protease [Alphaproteobacteria bacterium]|nr:rhomboid family intramembrane serine protease [Alphaproteobacteria bacterium]MBM3640257.1 rhomboid family intramembrane serine protease [Alphaproteobacteria bacterium]
MTAARERIFNLPIVTKTLIFALTAVQFVVAYGPPEFAQWLLGTFAFIPARVTIEGGAEYATMLTYFFLHGDWTHLVVNALALAAFGTPVERRFGSERYLLFLAASAFAGALFFLALHPYEIAPVVGASGAISGTMGAIVRFAFTPGARLADGRRGSRAPYDEESGSTSLSQLPLNRQAMFFLIAWLAANLLLGAFPQAAGVSSAIAWEAHVGGFLFGLLFFSLFDRAGRRALNSQ